MKAVSHATLGSHHENSVSHLLSLSGNAYRARRRMDYDGRLDLSRDPQARERIAHPADDRMGRVGTLSRSDHARRALLEHWSPSKSGRFKVSLAIRLLTG
jgi:hypothetical protein